MWLNGEQPFHVRPKCGGHGTLALMVPPHFEQRKEIMAHSHLIEPSDHYNAIPAAIASSGHDSAEIIAVPFLFGQVNNEEGNSPGSATLLADTPPGFQAVP
jgi:hypothetical protein